MASINVILFCCKLNCLRLNNQIFKLEADDHRVGEYGEPRKLYAAPDDNEVLHHLQFEHIFICYQIKFVILVIFFF